MIEWHKILGNALRDYFSDTCYSVGIDRELKIKQFIDILVIEEHEGKKSDDSFLKGLENLSKYNVITYKSLGKSQKQTPPSYLSFCPYSALRQCTNITICAHCRALNTNKNST